MNARKSNAGFKPSFSMERLEDRQMMAGDVAASVINGSLYINEAYNQAGGSNAVQVSQLSNGMIRVKGLQNQDGGLTLVDGQSYRDFHVSNNLIMNLGAGNDTVLVGRDAPVNKFGDIYINASSPNAGDPLDRDSINIERVTTRGAVEIIAGAGTDYVNVHNSTVGDGIGSYDDLRINTGDGAYAFVNVGNVATRGMLDIRTGNGIDAVDVSKSNIGDGVGIDNLNIYTGAGADSVRMNRWDLGANQVRGHLNVYTYNNDAELDADVVEMTSVTSYMNINVLTGGGADSVKMLGSFAGADILLSGGAGSDHFEITEVRSQDDFFASMGDGDDRLDMQYVGGDQLVLNGGAGFDSLNRWNNAPANDVVFSNWEKINGVNQLYFTGLHLSMNKSALSR